MALTSGLNSLNVDQATDEISNQAPVEQTLTSTEPTSAAEDATIRLQKQRAAYDQQLQKMMDSLQTRQNQFIDPKLAAMSAAFLDPGKTGSFGEAFGRAIKGYSDVSELENKEQRENAKMRLDLMKVSMSENEKNLIAQLTPKLFKTNEKGEYTGEMDPVIAQKIVAISGDPSIIQKIIEANKPNIKEVSPNATLFDVTHNKVLYQGTPKKTEFGQDLETLNDLKTQLSKDPNNKQLQDEVNKWSNYIKKKSEWEPKKQDEIDPEAVAADVDMIGSGQMQFPGGARASSPYWQAVKKGLAKEYPGWHQVDFNTMKQNEVAFTKGKQGDIVRSLNVVINHADTVRDLVKNLNNTRLPIWNAFANEFQTQTGQSAPTTFNAMKSVLADELAKGILGSAGALQDRITFQNSLKDAQSPQQLNDALDIYIKALGGQLGGLAKQYHAGTNKTDFADRFLFDRTIASIPEATKLIEESNRKSVYGGKKEETKETLPKGIPAGSTVIGKTPEGKTVYQAPNGKKYVE